MRRRSRRNRPINMLGAFLIEAGTMLAIVGLAQPTWTRNLIEQFSSAPQVSVKSVPVETVISNAGVFPATVEAAFASMGASHSQALLSPVKSGWQHVGTSAIRDSEPLRTMRPASETSERLAMAGWSVPSAPISEYAAAPRYSQYSVDPYASHQYASSGPQGTPSSAIRPIYPPPATSQSMPAWSNSY